MAEEVASQTDATSQSAVSSAPTDAVPVSQLSDQDSYLNAIGMDSDEEYNPDEPIAPAGKPKSEDAGDDETAEPETAAVAAPAATTSDDKFMAWLDKHTPEQIESLLKATQAAPAAKAAPTPEPEVSLDEIVKPLAAKLAEITGEDSGPAVTEFSKSLLKQVGNVYKQQIAQRDEKIAALSGQLDRVVAHIERQEVANALRPLAKTYPDIAKPGMRDQVEAKMRALAKTDEYSSLDELARDAALLTFGKGAVAAQADAKAKAAAAAKAGQPNAVNAQNKKPSRASYDDMRTRLAELAASGAGAKRMQQVKKELGW